MPLEEGGQALSGLQVGRDIALTVQRQRIGRDDQTAGLVQHIGADSAHGSHSSRFGAIQFHR